MSSDSYNDTTGDWVGLLTATREHNEALVDVERHRMSLELQLDKVRLLKGQQESAQATKQRATQELRGALTEGRELAIRLRGAVKANLGPKNEQLVQFGMAPLRKRARRAAKKPPEITEPGAATPPTVSKPDQE